MRGKVINIVILVDVIGTLASGSLHHNIYLIDNNKSNGSTNEGTGNLKTMVKEGDTIMWTILPLEVEAYASIQGIEFESGFKNKAQQGWFEESDVSYWIVKVDECPDDNRIDYKIKIKLGTSEMIFVTEDTPCLCFE